MKKTKAPTPEDAENYVWQGIHGIGGWSEGLGGFWLKTIPGILGKGRALTVIGVFALISRLAIVVLAAIFPLIVRKLALLTPSAASTQQPVNALGTLDVFQNALQTSTLVDYVLGLVAVVLVGLPKALDMFEREAKAEHHSPFKDLSAAIRSLPIREKISATETADTIRFTLLALREEMSILIGATSIDDVTDVALLEFCDASGSKMQVRTRTSNHEELNRPNDSNRFVAYYVAKEGRNFAEHDFKNTRNPFPPKRVSVRGGPDVNYRRVLYMPILCSERILSEVDGKQFESIVDSCVGVICVHSSKPYRFWRWGDHKKGAGGFADVAFSRSMPYIAVIEQTMNRTACKFKLEGK